jgi:hypothetical protein
VTSQQSDLLYTSTEAWNHARKISSSAHCAARVGTLAASHHRISRQEMVQQMQTEKVWRAVPRKTKKKKKNYNTILTYRKSLRALILPVVLYGCETWSLTLREERRLRVFDNRVLRRIFGPTWDEVTGGVEKTKSGAQWSVLLTKYYSGDRIVNNEMGGACSTYGGEVG